MEDVQATPCILDGPSHIFTFRTGEGRVNPPPPCHSLGTGPTSDGPGFATTSMTGALARVFRGRASQF